MILLPRIPLKPSDPTAPVRSPSKPHPPQKGLPRRGPPGIPYLQYRMQNWGACAGEVLARGDLEWTASPKEAVPPRSFPSVGLLTGGAPQGHHFFEKL